MAGIVQRHLRRRYVWLTALIVVPLLAIPALALSGSTSERGPRTYTSERYGYSLALPAGWQRAPRRLVPRLLDPREILSIGTFLMPVGGGGNCGREPVAALVRMEPGDVLVTFQEDAETRAMKRRLRYEPLPSLHKSLSEFTLRRELHAPSEHVSAAQVIWYGQLNFLARDRWFGALVYVKGRPRPDRTRQVHRILSGIHFDAGTFVRAPGSPPLPRRVTTARTIEEGSIPRP
jgi:hypothetical protein